MRAAFVLSLLLGCWSEPEHTLPEPAPDLVATPAPVPSAPVEVEPDHPEPKAAPMSPQDLHTACLVRVEFPESEGECKRDGQCVATGCSNEICVPKSAMQDGVMSTCEQRACFEVLDACTCQEGRCRWTLKGG